ncbi:hypothetical protein B0I35DRAFT_98581 [Stachybotrys elegans]|uniref:Uncharacterized protein n=1 Tax=Stachybotrys elegans TaxID=80388 RepID=A0A8K0SKZ1_9HYPO|nr:hypothetical protein B0I35DRAFT_98581 [Stachybotrys elegans]
MTDLFVGPTISALFAAIKLTEVSVKLKNVPQSAATFIQLVKQVDMDVEHALRCHIHAAKILEQYPEFYTKWISSTINATLGALKELNDFILRDTGKDFAARLEYLFSNHAKLVDQERMLSYVHSTLLSAINAMHLLIFRAESIEASPTSFPTPSSSLSPMTLSPIPTPPILRRYSRHRPPTKESSQPSEQCNPYENSPDLHSLSESAIARQNQTAADSKAVLTAEASLRWLQQSRESEISELDDMSTE